MLRLDSNDLTRSLSKTLVEYKYENTFTTQISAHLNLIDYDYETLISESSNITKQMDPEKRFKN